MEEDMAITRVSVTFEVDGIEGGGRYRFISEKALERYMRPERYAELMASRYWPVWWSGARATSCQPAPHDPR
jgi:hypothetical protein